MDIRFVTKQMHAFLDYPVAAALMGLPFVLGLGQANPMAFWLSFTVGVAALLLTLLTDHRLGVFRVLPYAFHLAVDGAVGFVFLIAPFFFGFTGIDAWYYWALGAAVMVVVGLHKPEPSGIEQLA
ncbi:MAG: hypothetical protein AAF414_16520 [Pseudomonadota bacterium]